MQCRTRHCSYAPDLDHLVDEYQEMLLRLIDHHAPIKEEVIRTRVKFLGVTKRLLRPKENAAKQKGYGGAQD